MPLGQLIRKARHGDLNDLKRKFALTVLADIRGNMVWKEKYS
jgi:hypothetical protein